MSRQAIFTKTRSASFDVTWVAPVLASGAFVVVANWEAALRIRSGHRGLSACISARRPSTGGRTTRLREHSGLPSPGTCTHYVLRSPRAALVTRRECIIPGGGPG